MPEKTKKQPKDIAEQLEELKLRQLRSDRIELERQRTKKELITTEVDIRKLESSPKETQPKPLNTAIIWPQLIELSNLKVDEMNQVLYLLRFWGATRLLPMEEMIPATMATIKSAPISSLIDYSEATVAIIKAMNEARDAGVERGISEEKTRISNMILEKILDRSNREAGTAAQSTTEHKSDPSQSSGKTDSA
ncbi:MAG: hypothetical protein ABSB29_05090 [Nitrososphaerales archaeon]|jgi:hypothetical protein